MKVDVDHAQSVIDDLVSERDEWQDIALALQEDNDALTSALYEVNERLKEVEAQLEILLRMKAQGIPIDANVEGRVPEA